MLVSNVLTELQLHSEVARRYLSLPMLQLVAEVSFAILKPFEWVGKKLDPSLSLQLGTANPGPYYTLPSDPVKRQGFLWNSLRRALYEHLAAVNLAVLPKEIKRRAQVTVEPGATFVVPWFGGQFALGDTVLAATAWELMATQHKVIVIVDDKFDGIKKQIVRRCAPSAQVLEVKVEEGLAKLLETVRGDEIVLVPSNYGKGTTGTLLNGIEEVLLARPSAKTFLGFFDWNPATKISVSSREEIVSAGSNPVVAYLQAQVCLRMSVACESFIVPRFYVSDAERASAELFLVERGVDVMNDEQLLVLVGDASSHAFKRLTSEQAEALLAQLVEEGAAQGLEVFFGIVDPGSSIDPAKLPEALRRRIVYYARKDGGAVASHQIMAVSRCLFVGCDSYVSHAYSAISRALLEKDGFNERRQILLFGWWGNLDEFCWIPCGPAEVIDARALVHPEARVTALPFGEKEDGKPRLPILTAKYTVV